MTRCRSEQETFAVVEVIAHACTAHVLRDVAGYEQPMDAVRGEIGLAPAALLGVISRRDT